MRMHMYSYAYLCNTILSHPCCASSQSAQPCAHHDREGFMYLRSVLFSLCLVIAVPASAQKVETADVAQVKEILKRSDEHTSELQSLMRRSYAVFCLKKKKK